MPLFRRLLVVDRFEIELSVMQVQQESFGMLINAGGDITSAIEGGISFSFAPFGRVNSISSA